MAEDELARAAIEHRRWKRPAAPKHARHTAIGVKIVRIWNRTSLEELGGVAAVVLRVDSKESDPASVLAGLMSKEWELKAAWPAPRSPLVDDHRVAAQVRQPRLERLGPPVEQLIGLFLQPLQAAYGTRWQLGTRRASRPAPAEEPANDQDDEQRQEMSATSAHYYG